MNVSAAIARAVGPDKRWVAGQFVLIGAVLAAGLVEKLRYGWGFTLGPRAVSAALGGALLVVAAGIAARAKADLGRSFTMSPTPVGDGELVQTGMYGVVRHPMYLSVVMLLLGMAVILGSWLMLAGTPVVLTFFLAKAAHEERLLAQRYPGYSDYRRRVRRRIVPGIL